MRLASRMLKLGRRMLYFLP